MSTSAARREAFLASDRTDGDTLKTAARSGMNDSGMASWPEAHDKKTSGLMPNSPAQVRGSSPAASNIFWSMRGDLRFFSLGGQRKSTTTHASHTIGWMLQRAILLPTARLTHG